MGVLRVDTDAEDLGTELAEFLDAIAEGDQFGWADEGEVQGVEEQNDVLAGVVGQGNLLDFSVNYSAGSEIWSRLGD